MAPAIMGYFGFGGTGSNTPKSTKPEPVRALPASWYSTREMYDLEKRAVFSRRWQLITHKCRLTEPGIWLNFEVASYEFVICKNQEGQITGFLANSLFPIHVRVDNTGFIWVNMDAKETPEVPWEEDFDGIDMQERYSIYNFDDYILDHVWQMEGDYNWKICADNFNECYHCPTSHPDIPELLDIETLDTTTEYGWIKHKSVQDEKQKAEGLGIASTYFYPNVSISVLPHYIMLQRFVPTGPSSCIMQYQIFRNKHSSEEDFQRIHQLYKKVVSEDKDLCRLSQKNLNSGVFINGLMHPRLEKGPLFFQQKNREVIYEFRKREVAAGKEIWPAARTSLAEAGMGQEDEMLCSNIPDQQSLEVTVC